MKFSRWFYDGGMDCLESSYVGLRFGAEATIIADCQIGGEGGKKDNEPCPCLWEARIAEVWEYWQPHSWHENGYAANVAEATREANRVLGRWAREAVKACPTTIVDRVSAEVLQGITNLMRTGNADGRKR